MAKNSFLDWDQTASNNTDVGGIGILGNNAVSNFDDALRTVMAQLRAGVDGEVVYAAKSGNYTAVANDNNAVHRYTAAATVTLTAAATLGANWHYTVVAAGGAVTIDPNGSETINGAATITVPNGASATIICDGSNFFTVFKPTLWEPIGTGKYVVTAGTSLNITDLSAYTIIRINGFMAPASAAAVYMRTSTNNGSSYDSGGTDYLYQTMGASGGAAPVASSSTLSALTVTNNAVLTIKFETVLIGFNQAGNMFSTSECYTNLTAGAATTEVNGAQRSSSTARNALQIICNGGVAFTGTFYIEGIRS